MSESGAFISHVDSYHCCNENSGAKMDEYYNSCWCKIPNNLKTTTRFRKICIISFDFIRTVACGTFQMALALYGGHIYKLYRDLILKAKLLNCNQILGHVTDRNYVAFIDSRVISTALLFALSANMKRTLVNYIII